MTAKITITVILIFAAGVGSVVAQTTRMRCPAGTNHRRTRVAPGQSFMVAFPQFEEYCQRRRPGGRSFKDGPYRLWGPNGEKLEDGRYTNGRREGKWMRWIPSQILQDTWKRGKYIGAEVFGSPSSYTIDFRSCVPHEHNIPDALGSTSYKLIGKEGRFCRMSYSIEIEMGLDIGGRPQTLCTVPRSVDKLVFSNTTMGFDFSAIAQYCKR